MFKTELRVGMKNVPIQYEIRDGNDLKDLSGFTAVRLYIQDYDSPGYITATVVSTGLVTITYPGVEQGEKKAVFWATDNTDDLIPLGLSGTVKVLGQWE